MTLRAPKGTDDILPPQSRVWRRLLASWERWSARFGYELALTPIFEATEVFARGVGESTEVVQKQMYSFEDKGGRSLTLRPEGTASIVRAFVQAGAAGELKLSYSGPMFRYEQPQAGRRRQFYQVGVEYLGTSSPDADAEIIELGYRYLAESGVPGLVVAINSLGDGECRPVYIDTLRSWLEDRVDELCPDSQKTLALNPMRVLDCKVCADVVAGAPSPVDFLCEACELHYASVRRQLDLRGVPYVETPRLVRGLDYYTRTAFEYLGTDLEAAQNAVGGGGRYDGLAQALGGPSVPSVGLALGIDRIVLALGESGAGDAPLDAFVVAVADAWRDTALGYVSELRREGVRVDATSEGRSLKAQMKVAGRSGAPYVLLVGSEWDDGLVAVKTMSDGSQEQMSRQEVGEWLQTRQ